MVDDLIGLARFTFGDEWAEVRELPPDERQAYVEEVLAELRIDVQGCNRAAVSEAIGVRAAAERAGKRFLDHGSVGALRQVVIARFEVRTLRRDARVCEVGWLADGGLYGPGRLDDWWIAAPEPDPPPECHVPGPWACY
jgi:hypothetical protein